MAFQVHRQNVAFYKTVWNYVQGNISGRNWNYMDAEHNPESRKFFSSYILDVICETQENLDCIFLYTEIPCWANACSAVIKPEEDLFWLDDLVKMLF